MFKIVYCTYWLKTHFWWSFGQKKFIGLDARVGQGQSFLQVLKPTFLGSGYPKMNIFNENSNNYTFSILQCIWGSNTIQTGEAANVTTKNVEVLNLSPSANAASAPPLHTTQPCLSMWKIKSQYTTLKPQISTSEMSLNIANNI